jgi:hypoxanthine phosphoribosyltransferase
MATLYPIITPLYSAQQLNEAIASVAQRINRCYAPSTQLSVVVLLQGALPFARALLPLITLPLERLELRASSYHGTTSSKGVVELAALSREQIEGREVLLVDDIYDSGRTLRAVSEYLHTLRPATLRSCVLLEKRREHEIAMVPDFVGLEVADTFLVGFGLDYQGKYRELDFVAELQPA